MYSIHHIQTRVFDYHHSPQQHRDGAEGEHQSPAKRRSWRNSGSGASDDGLPDEFFCSITLVCVYVYVCECVFVCVSGCVCVYGGGVCVCVYVHVCVRRF